MSIKMQMLNVCNVKIKSSNSNDNLENLFVYYTYISKFATDTLHYSVKTVDASYKLNDIKV